MLCAVYRVPAERGKRSVKVGECLTERLLQQNIIRTASVPRRQKSQVVLHLNSVGGRMVVGRPIEYRRLVSGIEVVKHLRWVSVQSLYLIYPQYISSQLVQTLLYAFVASVYLFDVVDGTLSVGTHSGYQQGYPCTNVG